MNIFTKGSHWESSRVADLERSQRTAWRVAGLFAICFLVAAVSLATLAPFRRTVPYLIKQDALTGNVEVLQSFDNRTIGRQELMDKFWARQYIQAREQYSWWLVGGDYDLVSRLTDPQIFPEYSSQFQGEKAMDKVFGEFTERKIKILSVAPAPTVQNQMVVRFERSTISKGAVVEAPTVFSVNLSYCYVPKTFGPEVDLIRNPMGYQVYSYRRDVEQQGSVPVATADTSVAGAKP